VGADPDEGTAGNASDDLDGQQARRRWAHLPEPVDPSRWVLTQPVPREPAPEVETDLARNFLLWGAG